MLAHMEVTVNSTNQKLGYTGALRSHPAVPIDYIPPLGDGQGYTPLELLLMSLGSCSGGTIGLLLRKMGKTHILPPESPLRDRESLNDEYPGYHFTKNKRSFL